MGGGPEQVLPRDRISIAALLTAFALSAVPASAEWRDEVTVLRVGFLAATGIAYDSATLEPFRAYLEGRLGVPVELVPATNYQSLIDAQATARTQYAIHSAASFAAARVTCDCVEPLAVPAAADGSTGFRAILVSRSDGNIRSLSDARDRRLAVSGEDSLAGRLVPLKALAREGIDPVEYFSAIVEKDGPQAAILSLFSGESDLAAGWSSLAGDAAGGYSFGILTTLVAEGAITMDEVRVIWQSPLIPFGPHAVRASLPDDLKVLLRDSLVAMADEAPDALDAVDRSGFGGGGFVAINASAYAILEEVVAAPPSLMTEQ
jgi:phosphonate transport system substrate-binding protein